MNFARSLCLTLVFASFTAMACFTPQRSAVLNKSYPDTNFSKMMHEMHSQPYKGYQFKGVTKCINGKADIYDCHNVDLIGHLNLNEIGGGQGSDSWGWKDQNSGRYFALVGRSNGTSFVEITDPASPIYLGNLPSPNGTASAWRDIKTYQNYAYIVADDIEDHGMQVFDLNQLLNHSGEPKTFSPLLNYRQQGFQYAHNIHINEATAYAYILGANTCAGGLVAVNLNNPSAPEYAGCYAQDGYTHDVQCVIYTGPDIEHKNKEICFASNEDTLTIVDVSNKNNMVYLSRTNYPGAQYVHQGWLSDDQKHFVLDDELDELARGGSRPDEARTYVMDLTNLDSPNYIGFHKATGKSIDHNQYIVNNHSYQANYSEGLRVIHLDNLSQAEMSEVAFFDTHPNNPAVSNFSGAWNVYPFFDNGMVLVSDINRGIFILKPNLPPTINIHSYHTGLWFNTEQSGHGLSLEVLADNRMAVYWYTYDKDGNQMWLVGTGTFEGNKAILDVARTSQAMFPPLFNPDDLNTEIWGQFEIEFSDCNNLNFTWFPNQESGFDSGEMTMTRLTEIPGLSCQNNDN
ncbi:choice-of-anchor B family protein [Marinicella rhabdoformis]|uniref:choice-of-anchor B family protein n=1 Tax=Marinicella rhabdoformis TaxID=2580566 RepID=UPI0012AEB2DA|nr:choice-of-anchor B family protein [Marinicella rhabdoformis]